MPSYDIDFRMVLLLNVEQKDAVAAKNPDLAGRIRKRRLGAYVRHDGTTARDTYRCSVENDLCQFTAIVYTVLRILDDAGWNIQSMDGDEMTVDLREMRKTEREREREQCSKVQ